MDDPTELIHQTRLAQTHAESQGNMATACVLAAIAAMIVKLEAERPGLEDVSLELGHGRYLPPR